MYFPELRYITLTFGISLSSSEYRPQHILPLTSEYHPHIRYITFSFVLSPLVLAYITLSFGISPLASVYRP